MSGKQLRWVLVLLGGLVVAWFLAGMLSGERGDTDGIDISAATAEPLTLIRVLDSDPADSVRVEWQDGWLVNGFPADSELVAEAVAALDSAPRGVLVARNPSNHARMGLANESGRRLVLGPPDSPGLVLLLGATGDAGRFVRIPGQDEVYSVAAEALEAADRNATDWRDRMVAEVDSALIGSIVVRRGESEVRLDRGAQWTVDGAPADSAAVERVLIALSEVQATGFPPDSVVLAADFDRPDAVLDVYGAGPVSAATKPLLSLLFLELESGSFMVRRADQPLAFGLAQWAGSRLLPGAEALLPAP
ncbi:MAG: DUF4340 domain-containing protein [Gemmatimonadota bacterium]